MQKQLIYAKTAYHDLFFKNSLFKRTCLSKIAYYDLFWKKKNLIQNNLLRSLFKKQLIYAKQFVTISF